MRKLSRNRWVKLTAIMMMALMLNVLSFPLSAVRTAEATAVSSASDTMTRQEVSVDSSHTIQFDLSGSETLAAGETVIVDFNEDSSGFVLDGGSLVVADIDFNDGTERTVVASSCVADEVEFSAVDATGIVTFTLCAGSTASSAGATVAIEIGTAAGGTDRLTNPASAGSVEINLSGTFGDDVFSIDVPVVDTDQVSVSATVDTAITFDLDIGDGSHANTNTPYAIDLQELDFATLTNESTSSVSEIYLDLTTNADGGAVVQVKSANGNLSSASTSDNIPSATQTNAVSSTDGNYGLAAIQEASATEGTLTPAAPFNVHGTANAVGAVTTSFQTIFNTGSAPIVDADGEVAVRAVAGSSTSEADDYGDTLTFIATATF